MNEKSTADMGNKAMNQGMDAAKDYADTARQYANRGYESAREYANRGYEAGRQYAEAGMDAASSYSANLEDFVRRDPWIAIVSAFAVGYVAARLLRRMSA